MAVVHAGAMAQPTIYNTREDFVKEISPIWQKLFGPVDFAKKEPVVLFDVVQYVWPRPVSEMTPIGDKKLSPRVREHHEKWFKEILQPRYVPGEKAGPTHFYFGNEFRTDLLRFTWRVDGVQIDMTESLAGLHFTIDPQTSAMSPEKGIPGKDVAALLSKMFRLPYESEAAVATAFKLPEKLQIGDVFTNAVVDHPLLMAPAPWHSFVVGFVGKNGVNIFCFKMEHNPESPEVRSTYQLDWLAGNVLAADGKTPIDRKTDQPATPK